MTHGTPRRFAWLIAALLGLTLPTCWAADEAPIVVYVHGWHGHAESTWEEVTTIKESEVVGYDKDGREHGVTGGKDQYSIGFSSGGNLSLAEQGQELAHALNAIAADPKNVGRKIVIDAHSMGGDAVRAALTRFASPGVHVESSYVLSAMALNAIQSVTFIESPQTGVGVVTWPVKMVGQGQGLTGLWGEELAKLNTMHLPGKIQYVSMIQTGRGLNGDLIVPAEFQRLPDGVVDPELYRVVPWSLDQTADPTGHMLMLSQRAKQDLETVLNALRAGASAAQVEVRLMELQGMRTRIESIQNDTRFQRGPGFFRHTARAEQYWELFEEWQYLERALVSDIQTAPPGTVLGFADFTAFGLGIDHRLWHRTYGGESHDLVNYHEDVPSGFQLTGAADANLARAHLEDLTSDPGDRDLLLPPSAGTAGEQFTNDMNALVNLFSVPGSQTNPQDAIHTLLHASIQHIHGHDDNGNAGHAGVHAQLQALHQGFHNAGSDPQQLETWFHSNFCDGASASADLTAAHEAWHKMLGIPKEGANAT